MISVSVAVPCIIVWCWVWLIPFAVPLFKQDWQWSWWRHELQHDSFKQPHHSVQHPQPTHLRTRLRRQHAQRWTHASAWWPGKLQPPWWESCGHGWIPGHEPEQPGPLWSEWQRELLSWENTSKILLSFYTSGCCFVFFYMPGCCFVFLHVCAVLCFCTCLQGFVFLHVCVVFAFLLFFFIHVTMCAMFCLFTCVCDLSFYVCVVFCPFTCVWCFVFLHVCCFVCLHVRGVLSFYMCMVFCLFTCVCGVLSFYMCVLFCLFTCVCCFIFLHVCAVLSLYMCVWCSVFLHVCGVLSFYMCVLFCLFTCVWCFVFLCVCRCPVTSFSFHFFVNLLLLFWEVIGGRVNCNIQTVITKRPPHPTPTRPRLPVKKICTLLSLSLFCFTAYGGMPWRQWNWKHQNYSSAEWPFSVKMFEYICRLNKIKIHKEGQ